MVMTYTDTFTITVLAQESLLGFLLYFETRDGIDMGSMVLHYSLRARVQLVKSYHSESAAQRFMMVLTPCVGHSCLSSNSRQPPCAFDITPFCPGVMSY